MYQVIEDIRGGCKDSAISQQSIAGLISLVPELVYQ